VSLSLEKGEVPRGAVFRAVPEASHRVQKDEDLAVSFIQIGNDPKARSFLEVLDDEIVAAGAPFDICDTVTLDEAESLGLTEVLLLAITD
jgi:hypothetical protein